MKRSELMNALNNDMEWDVVVIGGGATGLGAAVDAAARGFRTLLLEAYDFAKGTSSRSTKLVHGGVRYLARGEIGLVRQALRERGLLHKNAPHLTRKQAFVVPLYSWWEGLWYGTGLTLYNIMAGKLSLGRTRIIGAKKALRYIPTLERENLKGGVIYYDGQFDDSRLCIALLRTMLDHGGVALNYMPVTALLKGSNGRIYGVQARDAESGATYDIKARSVINATGIFADDIRHMDERHAAPTITFSQGIHFVLDRSFLPGNHAIMVPKTADGRVLFIIPWHNHVIVGTTDTPVSHAQIEPKPLAEELEFIQSHAARYLSKDPKPSDVLSVFTGLRPLVKGNSKSTASLSRDHVIRVSDAGLITISGGKWTTYRHMAEDVVDRAIKLAGLERRPCPTAAMNLHGWQVSPAEEPFRVYGADAPALRNLLAEQPHWAEPLHPTLPYLVGEVVWAARYELARTVEDVLSRRTRALLLNSQASREIAPRVAQLLAEELGHDQAWIDSQIEEYNQLVEIYTLHMPTSTADTATASA